MFKNIVFDLGNVLVSFDAKGYVKQMVEDEKRAELLYNEIFRSKEWMQYDRGVLELEGLIKIVQERVSAEDYETVKSLVSSWYTQLKPFDEMVAFVKELKSQGYKIYLLSNVSKLFYDIRADIPVLKYFDGEFVSADFKLLKPEQEIYLEFYKKFDLIPEECFFIDDLPINIEAAERTGMKGFVYHGDIKRLRGRMQKIGI